jgi:tRNA-specific 2-thiouridylase
MSGGVDSSVAAALLVEAGHDVVGATLKLWGGPSDSGCCSVADVDDARRVAQQLGIAHHVFDLSEDFEAAVVSPYVAAHAASRTPNPCIECNRHIKFDRLLARARRLGFDALATGHHARVERAIDASFRLLRGVDANKDQSYVLSMLGQDHLSSVVLPVGRLTKAEVRAHAAALRLRTAEKPDSQDVCFIASTEGRRGFLSRRLELRPGTVVDATSGEVVGDVDAVELVTVGQRRGMGHGTDGARRYVVAVEPTTSRVLVAGAGSSMIERVRLLGDSLAWVHRPLEPGARAIAQVSAHGRPVACVYEGEETGGGVVFAAAQRPVAPGQTIALYDALDPDAVVGSGIAA